MLSGRGLCDGPITRLEESYQVWCGVTESERGSLGSLWLLISEEEFQDLNCDLNETCEFYFVAYFLYHFLFFFLVNFLKRVK